jgi:hypothetical protein
MSEGSRVLNGRHGNRRPAVETATCFGEVGLRRLRVACQPAKAGFVAHRPRLESPAHRARG